jgi:hypothetical protein
MMAAGEIAAYYGSLSAELAAQYVEQQKETNRLLADILEQLEK